MADLQQYLVGSVEPVLAGDYNDDGVVDAADFTVWRDNWLSSGIGLPGDGDGDGFVGNTDYTLWANNFGATLPTLAVPEPSALGMLMVFVGGVLPFKR